MAKRARTEKDEDSSSESEEGEIERGKIDYDFAWPEDSLDSMSESESESGSEGPGGMEFRHECMTAISNLVKHMSSDKCYPFYVRRNTDFLSTDKFIITASKALSTSWVKPVSPMTLPRIDNVYTRTGHLLESTLCEWAITLMGGCYTVSQYYIPIKGVRLEYKLETKRSEFFFRATIDLFALPLKRMVEAKTFPSKSELPPNIPRAHRVQLVVQALVARSTSVYCIQATTMGICEPSPHLDDYEISKMISQDKFRIYRCTIDIYKIEKVMRELLDRHHNTLRRRAATKVFANEWSIMWSEIVNDKNIFYYELVPINSSHVDKICEKVSERITPK